MASPVCGFLGLPLFATYFALRVKNVIVAIVLTLMALFLAPVMGLQLLRLMKSDSDYYNNYPFWNYMIAIVAGYASLALPAYLRLRRNLARRIYSF